MVEVTQTLTRKNLRSDCKEQLPADITDWSLDEHHRQELVGARMYVSNNNGSLYVYLIEEDESKVALPQLVQ
jgi:hypothetical protein